MNIEQLQRTAQFHHASETSTPRPLAVDHWLASSLLQKAIRRGDADLAAGAALTLHEARGATIWRRFMVIAFEDIGAGCVEAVTDTVALGTDHELRARAGSDRQSVVWLARRLAHATKDRSSDYLLGAAQHHPSLEAARDQVGCGSLVERLALVCDATLPLPVRALAAWCASGLDRPGEKRLGRSDLSGLVDVYRMLKVPDRLTSAMLSAAKQTREPITVLVPLIALAAEAWGKDSTHFDAIRPSPSIDGVPAYAFDKHTRIGKRAITLFGRENEAVRSCLEQHLPDFRHGGVMGVAAFYADAMPVARRLRWALSDDLERMGMEADMVREGAPVNAVSAIVETVRANLDHLDEIRARLYADRTPRGANP